MASPPADLSVAVLTYNCARTVSDCLASVAAQHPRPAEVLVVDDDSTDDTLARVEALVPSLPFPVQILRNGQRNISVGRNIAIAAAAQPRVAFLDSDAYAAPGWIAALVAAFEADPGPAVVGGGVRLVHTSAFSEALALNDETVRRFFGRGVLLVNGCNMAVDRDRIGSARFDPDFVHAEDVEFAQRACAGRPWRVAPAALVDHESRATVRGYLRQMYRYGGWKVRYAVRTGDHRLVDYVPSAVLVASAATAPFAPLALLALPALGLAETIFVMAYRRTPPRLAGRLLLGWTVKNFAWGAGVLACAPAVARRGAP